MILTIQTQTSTQDMMDMPQYYEVTVRGGMSTESANKQLPEMQAKIIVPKSDVVDEVELLTVAELGAIAEFIEQCDSEVVALFAEPGKQCNVKLTVSQALTEELLTSCPDLVERVMPLNGDSSIPTSEYAALNVHILLAKFTNRFPSLESETSA